MRERQMGEGPDGVGAVKPFKTNATESAADSAAAAAEVKRFNELAARVREDHGGSLSRAAWGDYWLSTACPSVAGYELPDLIEVERQMDHLGSLQ